MLATIVIMAIRPFAALRVALLAIAVHACGGAPREVASSAPSPTAPAGRDVPSAPSAAKARPPIELGPTVLDAAALPEVIGPVPHNHDADPDRAGILAEGAERSGEIALTFDDGPAPDTTSEVLRILAAHRVKGAFFLTGHRLSGAGVVAEVNRGVARAIAAAGHTIGNHALDHVALVRSDAAWTTMQIEESARLIATATGVAPRFFRPPYGKLGEEARALVVARRDELVTWTIDAQDVLENDAERIAARLVAQILFAGQGIVLLHDLRPPSVKALALLLDWLDAHPRDPAKGVGYTVVDLPTYLAHAAARPWPYRDRLSLKRAREREHRLGR